MKPTVPLIIVAVLAVVLLAAGQKPGGMGKTLADDKHAVADLDTQYQAAVKANDATTMGRILSDDFILVTGKGKVYTKADLLKDARTKSTAYEHQEDTEQTVRIWGDTAVVDRRH